MFLLTVLRECGTGSQLFFSFGFVSSCEADEALNRKLMKGRAHCITDPQLFPLPLSLFSIRSSVREEMETPSAPPPTPPPLRRTRLSEHSLPPPPPPRRHLLHDLRLYCYHLVAEPHLHLHLSSSLCSWWQSAQPRPRAPPLFQTRQCSRGHVAKHQALKDVTF